MPSLVYEYVYFGAGGAHTRQPRATNAYGGFTPIPGLNSSAPQTLASNTQFGVPGAFLLPTVTVAETTYYFAFVNVSGLQEGGLTSFDHNVPPPNGTVGTNPVKVLVVYLPHGDGPPGEPGAVIDAFDETLGRLVDDNFVTVTVNGSSNAALTNSGNLYGWVETTNSSVTITAYSGFALVLEGMPGTHTGFDKWTNLEDGTSPAGLNLTVNQGQTVYAFAFYQDITKSNKEFVKEKIDVLKQSGKEKDGKELAEGGFNIDWVVDPYLIAEVQRLNTVIAALEIKIDTAIRGKAFIREEERPDVGKFNSGNFDRG